MYQCYQQQQLLLKTMMWMVTKRLIRSTNDVGLQLCLAFIHAIKLDVFIISI
jgi:hypothetical protein